MKKQILTLLIVFLGFGSLYGQWIDPGNDGTGNIYYNNGNVGIGTTTPSVHFEINKSINGTVSSYLINGDNSSNSRAVFLVGEQASGGNYGYLAHHSSNYNMGWGNYTLPNSTTLVGNDTNGLSLIAGHSLGKIIFGTGTTEKMCIDNYGYVGIGTPTPSHKLHIEGDALNSNLLKLRNNHWVCNQTTAIEFWNGGNKARATSRIVSKMDGCGTQGEALIFETETAGQTITSEKMIIKNNGDVGIGTTSPGYKLDVQGDIYTTGKLRLYRQGIGATTFYLESFNNNSTINVNSTSDYLTFNVGSGAPERLRVTNSGNVGIGTTTPSEKLSVNGSIRTKEVKVEAAPWPDYVFSEDYELSSLSEVSTYIKQNHHLPGIPTAEEVAENGIKLGEMNAKLLEKVEELTLYLIEEQERNNKLERRLIEIEKLLKKELSE